MWWRHHWTTTIEKHKFRSNTIVFHSHRHVAAWSLKKTMIILMYLHMIYRTHKYKD